MQRWHLPVGAGLQRIQIQYEYNFLNINTMIKDFLKLCATFVCIFMVSGCTEVPITLSDPIIPKSDRVVIIEDCQAQAAPTAQREVLQSTISLKSFQEE
jgi:hypothetical protein